MLMEVVMNSSKYGCSPLEIMKNNEGEREEKKKKEELMLHDYSVSKNVYPIVGRDSIDKAQIHSNILFQLFFFPEFLHQEPIYHTFQ